MTALLNPAAAPKVPAVATGPKSAAGKSRSSRNALRHGLRSEAPVLPGELAEDWQAHRDGIVRSLAPAGGLETALAERVALSLWRLRRVASYETAVTALGTQGDGQPDPEDVTLSARLAEAEQQLQRAREDRAGALAAGQLLRGLPRLPDHTPLSGEEAAETLIPLWDAADDNCPGPPLPYPNSPGFLAEVGVPEQHRAGAFDTWGGWTADLVRSGWRAIARAAGVSPEALLAQAAVALQQSAVEARRRAERLGEAVNRLRGQLAAREQLRRQARYLPDEATVNKLTRYEAHLGRQLLQSLHTLERLQAARAGIAVVPPAALDVTFDSSAGDNSLPAGGQATSFGRTGGSGADEQPDTPPTRSLTYLRGTTK
jgi:hypothetical protein